MDLRSHGANGRVMTDANHDPDSTSASDGSEPTGGHALEAARHRPHSLEDIRETYADQAKMMARMDRLNRLVTGRYRRVFGRAEGRVLDVACGTGTNVPYLPEGIEYVGVDLSPDVLEQAERQYAGLERGETLLEMDAQALAFPDDSFDTVISSLSTCTFPDPVAALAEMGRVCKPGGRVLLFEHGRSDVELIGRFQDWRADAHYEKHSCRWNQEPLDVLDRSSLVVREASTALLGILTTIEATPA